EPTRPLCSVCGRLIGKSTLALWRTLGRQPEKAMHRTCRTAALKANRHQVRCVTCPNTAWLSQTRIKRLKWTEKRLGVIFRYCGDCSRRRRADVVRLFSGTLRKH